MTKRTKITFPKGIHTVHIPFIPEMDSFDQLYKQIDQIEHPRKARRIEASIEVSIDLRKGETSYQVAEVRVIK